MMDDMSASRDESQYGNEKGVSVNHYLIKMIHEILLAVDKNSEKEKFAVFCAMVDKHSTGNVRNWAFSPL